jgi:hypothetical protein
MKGLDWEFGGLLQQFMPEDQTLHDLGQCGFFAGF